ncbi:hypothetical protein IMSHALPRED_002298 [Imshaugia aleurites]|uniref:Uncharacterized protein n=1 Tax=Imshaugia aleurites TaxID=172621 RepID=A0A8H3IBU4_9LECA|nr:hypothetical protein IMSHALPRED_002298 [Imshaugia aleurites]
MKNFAELILWGESQPSTGTARLVERPNGETRFVVAYGSAPDYEIRALLGDIFLKHGAVTLHHDGRDATGKHWFKCYGRGEVTWQYDGRDSSGEHWSICFGTAEPKAIICVSSKFPPKVLGVVEDAPKDLFLLPLSQQLRWLEPDVAQAVRERLETENLSGEFCG